MRFQNWKQPKIREGKLTKWNWMVQNVNGLVLGENTDIGAFTYINAKNGVFIYPNVQIGSHCSIYSVSTIDNKNGSVYLMHNCCIGSHSTIMPNITIGRNAIVAAHSFVNCDIPANEVWAGVPAKKIR